MQSDCGAGHADFGQAGADWVLTGDEGSAASRAALLAIPISERRPFLRYAVDVGGLVAHHPLAVAADVPIADVVAPDDEDVRFVGLCHATLLGLIWFFSNCLFGRPPPCASIRDGTTRRRKRILRREQG